MKQNFLSQIRVHENETFNEKSNKLQKIENKQIYMYRYMCKDNLKEMEI